MKLNPIFERDLAVQSRSYGMPLLVVILNMILFAAGLLGMFGMTARMRMTGMQEYGAFLELYGLVASMSFLILLLVTPSLSAGVISGERQTDNLDLLLTTQMTPMRIVTGKLYSAAWMLGVVFCSALPALLIPLIYGGISVFATILLLFMFFLESVYLLLVGLFSSSFGRSAMRSSALAYGLEAALCIGTALAAVLARPLASSGNNVTAYLLVLNPVASFLAMLASLLGRPQLTAQLFSELNLAADPAFTRFFVPVSLLFQLALSVCLLLGAAVNIAPMHGKRQEERKMKHVRRSEKR